MIPLHKPWIESEDEAAVLRVLRSGRLAGNGAECTALERELQARLGGGHAVVLLSSATHALELSMLLLDLQGGEVIVPSFTFPSVGSAILRAGGVIRFCEVREPDLNVDLEHVRSLIGPATRAVVITHYAGHPQDIAGIPVPVVEDAAHAFGSEIDGRPCGTLGRFGKDLFCEVLVSDTKRTCRDVGGHIAPVHPDDAVLRAARPFGSDDHPAANERILP